MRLHADGEDMEAGSVDGASGGPRHHPHSEDLPVEDADIGPAGPRQRDDEPGPEQQVVYDRSSAARYVNLRTPF